MARGNVLLVSIKVITASSARIAVLIQKQRGIAQTADKPNWLVISVLTAVLRKENDNE